LLLFLSRKKVKKKEFVAFAKPATLVIIMNYPLNIDCLPSNLEFADEVHLKLKESRIYLESQKWCNNIINGWLFTNLGYVFCIFLYEVENIQSPEDNFIWVVVGDLPPVYLDTIKCIKH
jgi:hypothetical protein